MERSLNFYFASYCLTGFKFKFLHTFDRRGVTYTIYIQVDNLVIRERIYPINTCKDLYCRQLSYSTELRSGKYSSWSNF